MIEFIKLDGDEMGDMHFYVENDKEITKYLNIINQSGNNTQQQEFNNNNFNSGNYNDINFPHDS